jgi:hypothetical protein
MFRVIESGDTDVNGTTFMGLPEGSVVWAGNYGFTVTYTGGDGNDFVLTMDQFANTPPLRMPVVHIPSTKVEQLR